MQRRNCDQGIGLDKELRLWSSVDYAEWDPCSLDFPSHSDAVNSVIFLLNSFLQGRVSPPISYPIIYVWGAFLALEEGHLHRVRDFPAEGRYGLELPHSKEDAQLRQGCARGTSYPHLSSMELPSRLHFIYLTTGFQGGNFGITWNRILVLELKVRSWLMISAELTCLGIKAGSLERMFCCMCWVEHLTTVIFQHAEAGTLIQMFMLSLFPSEIVGQLILLPLYEADKIEHYMECN